MYLIFEQSSGGATGVYISRTDGRIDQLTGNSHESVEAAEKLLKKAKVEYRVVTDTLLSGNGRD